MAFRARGCPELISCPICGNEDNHVFSRVTTPYGDRRERYEILVCGRCTHGFAIGRHDPSFLSEIYSGGFHHTSQQDTSDVISPVYVNARERANWLLSKGLSGKLIDIGCGRGAFVEVASERFFACGIDLSSTAAEAARQRGLDVCAGEFLASEFDQEKFDVITFWDVLAGFVDIRAVLRKSASLMAPSGVIVASVPMIDSLAARVLRSHWPLMLPPVNLHYFSRRSIKLMADSCGLDVIEMSSRAKKVALNFLLMKAARSLRLFRLASWMGSNLPPWPVNVNTHDITYVVFRRSAQRS